MPATLFTNATFLTMDPARPTAPALLVRDGRVLHTGAKQELRAQAPDAELVDLGGRFAVPGFVDAHNHFSLTALEPLSIDCRTPPVRSLDGLLERVHAAAAAVPAGRWLRGHGYDEMPLGGRHVTREQLDSVAPEHPLVLIHWTVHRCVANSAALRALGLDAADGDPPGGWIVRDAAGTPSGLLYERATDPLQSASLAAYVAAHGEALPALFAENARLQLREGITGVGDAYVHPSLHAVYAAAHLPLAVRPFCGSPAGLFAPPHACLAPDHSSLDGRLLPRGVKIFVDGGGNTTATSLADGRPPRFLFYRQDELDALLTTAGRTGLPVAIHAAGDIAVTMALDAVAAARRAVPDAPLRVRIEHAITLKQTDIPRFAELGVILVTQPEMIWGRGARLAEAPLAPGVRVAPWRDLLDAGATLAFSSDSPCYALPPLWQIWCAVTRMTAEGAPLADGQTVTVEEAFRAYTATGAAAIFAADAHGSLAPGRRADLAVLSDDPRTLPPDRWPALAVHAVYVDGAPVPALDQPGRPPPGRPRPH